MISSLHIENIAVVKRLDIELGSAFNVLTGETGAGKSIIIDSLNLLLGARADKELIRTGESSAEVSAVFTDISDEAETLLCELGFRPEDRTVMLSRMISADGKGVARVDGRIVTLSVLREISAQLVNIHGQNDNQTLLRESSHIHLLDKYAKNAELLEKYSELYRECLHLKTEIDSIKRDSMEAARLCEMLRYQIDDIDSAKLRSGEDEALVAEEKRLLGLEHVKKNTDLVRRAILGSDKGAGASYLCDRASAALAQIADAFPEAQELSERIMSVRYELDDIAESATALCDIGDINPTERLDKIGERLQTIARLQRKYGATVDDVLAFRDDAVERLSQMENADVLCEELEQKLGERERQARIIAGELHVRREKSAKALEAAVCESLSFLDMPKVRFEVAITQAELGAFGVDSVSFLISTNVGEPLMPMVKIASGGELSRIMLSLRSALNDLDGVQTAIFDEIDTGISGKTSRKVGMKLQEISAGTQVICVTHSAQIASLASTHFYISKSEEDGRAQTSIRVLDDDARVDEIARILGGIEISEIQRSAAREMIKNK